MDKKKWEYGWVSPALSTLQVMPQQRYYLVFLALLSSICFWLSWPPNRFTPLLFVILTPLLLIERHIEESQCKRPYWAFYKYAYLTLFLWNLATTWWVAYATVLGTMFMLLVNTLFMSLPLPLFQFVTKHCGRYVGYLALLASWISMEHTHLQWELSFPWLNFGNGFACWPEWVQWYEYTGALGGTIWVIVANLLLSYSLTSKRTKVKWRLSATIVCWVLLPMLWSYYTYLTYREQGKPIEIVVMQPNINPYTGAFEDTGEVFAMQKRVEYFIQLSQNKLTPRTQFLVWPECAIDSLLAEQQLDEYPLVKQLVDFTRRYPQLSVLTGVNSLVGYTNKKATKTARFSHRYGYYDIFNTALFVGNQGTLATYHKSKLVPGVELVPYVYSIEIPKILTPDLRGKLNSLGMQDHPSLFLNREAISVAPAICYEAIYGDYLSRFVRMGASLIFSMSIDGWWKDTPGYQQHFHYTRLRAIESRRSVARAALKGISAFINQRGEILKATQYKEQAAIRHTLQANTKLTFYVRHSQYIANAALWVSLLLFVSTGLKVLIKKREDVYIPKI